MWVTPLIERKRDRGALEPQEWRELVLEYAAGRVPDYQMAALLMAVFLNGIEPAELGALAGAMLESGEQLRLDHLGVPLADKHSTGGVGDKVSLVLAPLVASCGVGVPMIAGRGLGHTGGTLDKLEAIPGLRTTLTVAEVQRQMELVGCVMIGQSEEIAPADRRLYALRDATGTVAQIPLIAASIMSKKLAEGLRGLVLDVKRGSGALLPGLEDGLALARTMIALGEEHGCRTVALLSAMDRPLGRACGNALEVEEAIATLAGEGPADVVELTMALAIEMLLAAGAAPDAAAARVQLARALASGKALEKLRSLIVAQGGHPGVVDDPAALPQANAVAVYAAPTTGTVVAVEPGTIGRAIIAMGGGRRAVDDTIDPAVGFVISANPGDRVECGEPLASVYARDAEGLRLGTAALERAIRIAEDGVVASLPLVSHRVTMDGIQELIAVP
jgi:pyrimidine-nucleoside phosphorylase